MDGSYTVKDIQPGASSAPEVLALQQFHCPFPDLLRFQNSFVAAVKALQDATVRQMPAQVKKV